MGGEKGDGMWPSINAAQMYIEAALPELVVDAIKSSLYGPRESSRDATAAEATLET